MPATEHCHILGDAKVFQNGTVIRQMGLSFVKMGLSFVMLVFHAVQGWGRYFKGVG